MTKAKAWFRNLHSTADGPYRLAVTFASGPSYWDPTSCLGPFGTAAQAVAARELATFVPAPLDSSGPFAPAAITATWLARPSSAAAFAFTVRFSLPPCPSWAASPTITTLPLATAP